MSGQSGISGIIWNTVYCAILSFRNKVNRTHPQYSNRSIRWNKTSIDQINQAIKKVYVVIFTKFQGKVNFAKIVQNIAVLNFIIFKFPFCLFLCSF